MTVPLMIPQTQTTKRLDSDYYVEGYATTFNSPYQLAEYNGISYNEQVDSNALADADLSDVIFQYNHKGTVFARNKMGNGKQPSLIVEPRDSGLFVAADLGLLDEARQLYTAIQKGLIYKMSWAFRVAEDSYDKQTRTRTIRSIKKVYDVSAVSMPANQSTNISARSWVDAIIETETRESLEKRAQLLKLSIEMEELI